MKNVNFISMIRGVGMETRMYPGEVFCFFTDCHVPIVLEVAIESVQQIGVSRHQGCTGFSCQTSIKIVEYHGCFVFTNLHIVMAHSRGNV